MTKRTSQKKEVAPKAQEDVIPVIKEESIPVTKQDVLPIEIRNNEFKILLQSATDKKTTTLSTARIASLIVIMFIVIAYTFSLLWYVAPTNKVPVQNLTSSLSLAYTTPKYLAIGDENTIEVTLTNNDVNLAANGTLTLVFVDSTVSVETVPDQRMSFQIEELLSGDRTTRRLKLKLATTPSSNKIEFYFQFSLPDGTQYKSKIDTISISPISNIRTTWSWVTGASGILALIIGFLFERLKNILGFR